MPHFTQEKAELEALKIELSYTRTKIVDLETKLDDKNNSLKIYKHKVSMLESSRMNKFHNEYLAPKVTTNISNTSSLCSCSVQQILLEHANRLTTLETKMNDEYVSVNDQMSSSSQNQNCTVSQRQKLSSNVSPSVVVDPPRSPLRVDEEEFNPESPSKFSVSSAASLMSAQTHFSQASSSDFDFSDIDEDSLPKPSPNLN